jgi:hypothetical protein
LFNFKHAISVVTAAETSCSHRTYFTVAALLLTFIAAPAVPVAAAASAAVASASALLTPTPAPAAATVSAVVAAAPAVAPFATSLSSAFTFATGASFTMDFSSAATLAPSASAAAVGISVVGRKNRRGVTCKKPMHQYLFLIIARCTHRWNNNFNTCISYMIENPEIVLLKLADKEGKFFCSLDPPPPPPLISQMLISIFFLTRTSSLIQIQQVLCKRG